MTAFHSFSVILNVAVFTWNVFGLRKIRCNFVRVRNARQTAIQLSMTAATEGLEKPYRLLAQTQCNMVLVIVGQVLVITLLAFIGTLKR